MSPYITEEVTKREDLDSIVDIIWAAMDGSDPSHQVFYPVLGTKPEDRKAAIESSKDRTWEDHKSDQSSHWIFVRDVSSGDILGGCQWRIYTANPFPDGTPYIEAVWWPEGEERRFASEVVRQCYTPRTKWMAYPHVGLSLMCVHPEFQRRGIGRLLMEWGLERMDGLELEGFIEATPSGKGLYSKSGFRPVKDVSVDMTCASPSEEWRRLMEQLLPIGYTAMWRPRKGVWRDGEPEITWASRLQATDY